MKAVIVEAKGKLKVVNDCPLPEIGPYDALVRIHACGFCNGTDTRILFDEVLEHQLMQPFPAMLGHEAAGIVVAVGEKVKNIKVGEKHIHVLGFDFKGHPYTRAHAQMAEYGYIPDTAAMRADGILPEEDHKLCRLPDDFSLIDAGVMLPMIECLSAVKNFGISADTDVLVYGAGPMGLAMMCYMHILKVKSVTVIDSVPERLDAALKIAKVDKAINFKTQDVEKELGGAKFDRVVDAVGLSSVISEASTRLRPFGVVCSLGVLRKDDAHVDLTRLTNNTLVHMLNFPYEEYAHFEENLSYIQDGLIDPKVLYSHVMPLEDVEKAVELVLNKQTTKVILTI
jgi:threonine dehydrogenase-like Zn-dependent dehydrogenase